MKDKKGYVAAILVILAILGYILLFYPLTIQNNGEGDVTCKSILGLTVGC